MLDVKWVRHHVEELQQVADAKGLSVSVHEFVEVEAARRRALQEVEMLREERNQLSREMAKRVAEGEQAGRIETKNKRSQVQLREREQVFRQLDEKYQQLLLQLPNYVSPDTPFGKSDADNVEWKRVGEIPRFDFPLKDHVELATLHHMLDIRRGVKVSGARGYFLQNDGVHLHRAVQQLCIDLLATRRFTVMDVPVLVREQALWNTGFFPVGRESTYLVSDDLWLAGTAEVPLVSYYANEVIDVTEPIRLAGVSPCFRREVGSAGRDVHGLYRVHQFAKVEQVILCENNLNTTNDLFDEITQNAEDILDLLELPYRVVRVCTGDLSQKNYKQLDIETWMPSRNAYGETHSSSILLDFQSRRSNIRYRDKRGQLAYCHTLNNTAVASPRILIPLLENHQREDGSIYIPKALRPYMNGRSHIHANR